MEYKNDLYSFTLCIFHETEKGIFVGKDPDDKDDDKAFWLPKSQVTVGDRSIKNGIEWSDIQIPEWLAEKSDLDVSLDGDLVDE